MKQDETAIHSNCFNEKKEEEQEDINSRGSKLIVENDNDQEFNLEKNLKRNMVEEEKYEGNNTPNKIVRRFRSGAAISQTMTFGEKSKAIDDNATHQKSSIEKATNNKETDIVLHNFEPEKNDQIKEEKIDEIIQTKIEPIVKRQSTGPKTISCSQCGNFFQTLRLLSDHKNAEHARKQIKVVTKKSSEKKVSKRRPPKLKIPESYDCKECGKHFSQKKSFARHAIHHTKEKNFQCTDCDKLYADKNNLKTHVKLLHPESFDQFEVIKEYKVPCNECDQKFAHNSDLEMHKVKAHDHPYYAHCEECGKGFVRLDHGRKIARHQKKCPNAFYKACVSCGKGFTRQNFEEELKLYHYNCDAGPEFILSPSQANKGK